MASFERYAARQPPKRCEQSSTTLRPRRTVRCRRRAVMNSHTPRSECRIILPKTHSRNESSSGAPAIEGSGHRACDTNRPLAMSVKPASDALVIAVTHPEPQPARHRPQNRLLGMGGQRPARTFPSRPKTFGPERQGAVDRNRRTAHRAPKFPCWSRRCVIAYLRPGSRSPGRQPTAVR